MVAGDTNTSEQHYTLVTRSREETVIAVLRAAIDDIRHTSNMTDRTHYELGLSEGYEYISENSMVDACEWAITLIAQEAGWQK